MRIRNTKYKMLKQRQLRSCFLRLNFLSFKGGAVKCQIPSWRFGERAQMGLFFVSHSKLVMCLLLQWVYMRMEECDD